MIPGALAVLERALSQVSECKNSSHPCCDFSFNLFAQVQDNLRRHMLTDTADAALQRASVSLVTSSCVDATTETACAAAADRLLRFLQVPPNILTMLLLSTVVKLLRRRAPLRTCSLW
jgi:hypothetical protein